MGLSWVPAAVVMPFSYGTYDLNASLFVAMKVYDTSGASPSLVGTFGMDHVVNGTYVGKFTPVEGKSYLINKMVYTDGTYSTPDSANYSPDEETLYAHTVTSGGGGGGSGNCGEPIPGKITTVVSLTGKVSITLQLSGIVTETINIVC